ncbi:hypothetical protein TNCV_112111 [Trichonephila clavipes]|nr:hypothetical protein TNCV_112111 [Trichonephila clavipes]
MNGCVAAISVDTGKVLDIEVICRPTVQHIPIRSSESECEESEESADEIDKIEVYSDIYVARDGKEWTPHNNNVPG